MKGNKIKSSKGVFVAGIGTDVGKTVISAILTEHFKFDYWKPLQCGNLEKADSDTVRELISNEISQVHDEVYNLEQPVAPTTAAKLDNITIDPEAFVFPKSERPIVVEGVGGLLVPLTERLLVIDLIRQFEIPIVLVVRHYLGSINHTLLSIEALKSREINLIGLVISGGENKESEEIICKVSNERIVAHVPLLEEMTQLSVKMVGDECFKGLYEYL